MIKVWKIFSFLIVGVVCLAMVLGPSVPVVSAQPLNCGIEVQPNMTKVGFNEAFSVAIVVNNSAGLPLAGEGVYINFTKDLIEVVSITTTGTPFTQVLLPPAFDNNAGTIDQGAGTPPGTNTTAVAPLVMTINMQSKNATGTATIQFANMMPTRVTKVLHETAGDILNWTMVVNGTVMVGPPTLKVCVNPVGMGSVEADGTPLVMTAGCNTTTWTWDDVVNLEAVNSTPGWGFVNWTGDVSDPNSTSTTVTIDTVTMNMSTLTKSVTANFEELDPKLSVSPSSLTVPVLPNGTANASYTITNIGGKVLSWNSSNVSYVPDGNMTWLTQNPVNGNLTANVSDTVLVIANATGLAVGTYNATINITGNSSVELPITLIVGTPEISVNPTSLAFTTNEGENPANRTLEVWNSGSGMLNWNMTDDAAWLDENPTTGNSTGVDNKTSVTVSVDVSGMAAGDYSATITITDPLANNTPQTVSVSLAIAAAAEVEIPEVTEVPEIIVGPAQLSASALSITPQQVEPGRDVTISINVANTGGGTGSYNAVLYINGVVEDSQAVSVAAGTTKNVIFTVSKSEAGVYDVLLAGQSGQFEVVGGGIFGGGLGTGGIIAIVVIVIVLIAAVVFILRGTTKPE